MKVKSPGIATVVKDKIHEEILKMREDQPGQRTDSK